MRQPPGTTARRFEGDSLRQVVAPEGLPHLLEVRDRRAGARPRADPAASSGRSPRRRRARRPASRTPSPARRGRRRRARAGSTEWTRSRPSPSSNVTSARFAVRRCRPGRWRARPLRPRPSAPTRRAAARPCGSDGSVLRTRSSTKSTRARGSQARSRTKRSTLRRMVGAACRPRARTCSGRAPDRRPRCARGPRGRACAASPRRLRTEFQKRDESMRCPPSLAAGHLFSPQKKRLARLVHEHRVVGDGAPVVVQVVRALGVRVVGAGVEGEVALVVDRELVRVEVVVLGEVGTAGELDPGRRPVPSRRAAPRGRRPGTAARAAAPRRVVVAGSRGTTVSSRHRNSSTGMRQRRGQPAALLEQPGRERVLEAMHGVAEHHAVDGVEVRELVVVVARRRAVGQDLVEVGRAHVAEHAVAARGIVARRGAAQLGHQGQRRPGDPHVVHRLVVAALRVHELRRLQDVVESARRLRAQRRRPRLDRGVSLDRGQREHGQRELAHGVVVVRGLAGIGQRLQGQHALRAVHQLAGHAVLERGVEARRSRRASRRPATSSGSRGTGWTRPCVGRSRAAHLLDRAPRERLVAGEQVA